MNIQRFQKKSVPYATGKMLGMGNLFFKIFFSSRVRHIRVKTYNQNIGANKPFHYQKQDFLSHGFPRHRSSSKLPKA